MKTGLMFSGQGAQYLNMMKYFYDNISSCKRILEIADDTLHRSIANVIFGEDKEELNKTVNTQPCILAASLMSYTALKENGITADAVAGFSLGEYTALVASEVFDVETAFKIIDIRAKAMQNAAPIGSGGMAAILNLDENQVLSLCKQANGYVIPVNYNCPGQIVVSGEMKAIDSIVEIAKAQRIRALKLPVSAPCHCKYMNPVSEVLTSEFEKVKFNNPIIPVYMNVDGLPETNPKAIKEKLILQVKSPVRWMTILNNMHSDGIDTFIECGPGKTLSNFTKKTLSNVHFANVEDEESLNKTLEMVR